MAGQRPPGHTRTRQGAPGFALGAPGFALGATAAPARAGSEVGSCVSAPAHRGALKTRRNAVFFYSERTGVPMARPVRGQGEPGHTSVRPWIPGPGRAASACRHRVCARQQQLAARAHRSAIAGNGLRITTRRCSAAPKAPPWDPGGAISPLSRRMSQRQRRQQPSAVHQEQQHIRQRRPGHPRRDPRAGFFVLQRRCLRRPCAMPTYVRPACTGRRRSPRDTTRSSSSSRGFRPAG